METGSGVGGVFWITTECDDSGMEAPGNETTGCGSIKDGNETGSDSRMGSTGCDGGDTGGSTLKKKLGASLETVGGSSGREGSAKILIGVGPGISDSLIAAISELDPFASLAIAE